MFGTSGVRGRFGSDVTADLALSIGRAVASDGADRIVLGRDPRTTGDLLADAAAAGARECGADVIDLGLAATPTIARSVGWQDADAGIAVTASHNPPEDNGLKLWEPSGQAFGKDHREQIARTVQNGEAGSADWEAVGSRTAWNGAEDRHVAAIVDAIAAEPDSGLADLEVVVDVGNGAGGITVRALRELGCSVTALNERPDGHFPSRPSEPTEENLAALGSVVGAADADLGVAHDGDADRMMAVDETGRFVGGDALLALFATDAVEGSAAGSQVAAPVNTSLAVDDALAGVGADLVRTRVGDVFVAERASQPDVGFGGEPSGAWIWPGETLAPDGPLAACRLAKMVADGGPLSAMVGEIEQYPIRRDSREVAEKAATMERIRSAATDEYADAADSDVETLDGVRVTTDDGWFLVRASGTQPLIRVTAEAREAGRADELLAAAHGLLDDAIVE
ncbi:phosphoglucosamine mutase [Salinarchaeum sp. Harcht-Bsk1]|uniref:phosphoglucosamine mutase n=1 Tax=Salinarchaeum sp. Harcht-Bsk1 TaxID=1333523 RepID=UPI0003422C6B|nr:phosphoglucosamine mutase [Salinarchaeum sp. Harcht-Bsk1]AGN00919.1 phosphoglucosamine mutase [Salinarchaeum sp. Harcht-Bsk1]